MRRWLQHGPLRPLIGTLSNLAVHGQLAGVKLKDAVASAPETPNGLEDVTALIKTFERPYAVHRLVTELQKRHPSLSILVVDDSEEPGKLPGVKILTLPFDSGVSAGRQAGLDAVTTPFTLLLDDDYVPFWGTRLDVPLKTLRTHPEIDLVAGGRIDLPLMRRARPHGLWPTDIKPRRALGEHIGGLPVTHKPPNFYLARTERLRQVGWDPQVKRLDHADFFTRALGELVCVEDERWSILHARNPFDDHYQAYRMDVAGDRLYLAAKYGGATGSPRPG